MSDILVVLPSEMWGALKQLAKESGGSIDGFPVWGDGRGPSLQEFLDKQLAGMVYDENVHIITRVSEVKTETRCPYPHILPNHRKCGWTPCPRCKGYPKDYHSEDCEERVDE